uniref:Uncharacterized protein n=1 Tax=Oryza punctata TaxID=4537 RepID=A0A0E0M0A0_ORYPU
MPEATPDELDCGASPLRFLARRRRAAAAAIEFRRVHHHSAPLATHLFHRPHLASTYELRRRRRWGFDERRDRAIAGHIAGRSTIRTPEKRSSGDYWMEQYLELQCVEVADDGLQVSKKPSLGIS